jgi:hypothetical protein
MQTPRPRTAVFALACVLAAGLLTAGCGAGGDEEPATGAEPTSTASIRASEFEASVSAETEAAAAEAQKQLKHVRGRGNAMGEVSMTGLPRNRTGGVLAVLLHITNKTDRRASYAVEVDFKDAHGKVVERRYAGARNLDPGDRAEPIVFSREPPEPRLTPKLTKAQRY